jgi:pimeloyl-ACP methyl ester carboxylesterase
MAKMKANGIELYYEIHGEGRPLVLFEGLGYASWMWYKQVDKLSKHFKVIIIDNRGIGHSEKPDVEYSISMMADDAYEILRALNINEVNVLGVSMGGFIAQEFALKHPEMVDKLILCSTSFGGPNIIPIPQETLDIMLKGGGEVIDKEEARNATASALNKESVHKNIAVIDWIIASKEENPQPRYAYHRQLLAGASFNAEERIHDIKAETLILAGRGDRVVPYENAYMISDKIPGSTVEIIDGGGHVFFMEEPETANEIIINFLKS